jgi:hypothetical protein
VLDVATIPIRRRSAHTAAVSAHAAIEVTEQLS